MINKQELLNALEAVLFATDEAIDIKQISKCLNVQETICQELITRLNDKYANNSGIKLKEINDGYLLIANSNYNDYIKKLKPIRTSKLSRAAMETLAIIAFKQPITKVEITDLRGVKCDSVVSLLLSKGLIEAVGRKETIGKPILYGTTEIFIQYFGLNSIDDLPKPENLRL